MSVSDPLIKELKGWIIKFITDSQSGVVEITDDNEHLHGFCICLENIFTKGLTVRSTPLGFPKQSEAWTWLLKIAKAETSCISYSYITAVERVRAFPCVGSNIGRLRLLIRSCLVHQCLHSPVQALSKVPYTNIFYHPHYSILGDEILREITLSILLQCANLRFNLVLSRATFLDDTWLLPHYETIELMPCISLGLSVTFVNGKAVIINIKPSSVADDEAKLEVGDILDELNGNPITPHTQGKLSTIMRNSLGKPIRTRIIKARLRNSRELYPPIVGLLKELNIDPDFVRSTTRTFNCEDEDDLNSINKTDSQRQIETGERKTRKKTGYEAIYVGCVSTGQHGEVKHIDRAVRTLLSTKGKADKSKDDGVERCRKTVTFEIQEIGVKISDTKSGELVLHHSYMEIASCGSTGNFPNYFAYIAGDKYCNVSKSFTCHIFYSENDETLQFILHSIAQGFQRTHFAV